MHDEDIRMGRKTAEVHETLDPKLTNKNGDHTGQNIREAMDSDEHPNATAIAVIFDDTGSMREIPTVLQKKLAQLDGTVRRKGYVEDPQILFGAVGDAYSDRVPLQIGQFESDNTSDENLENLFLESGGGGGMHESYELALYFLARHTYLDSVEKRGKKGYAFIIGDEKAYKDVNAEQVRDLIGGISAEQTENIPIEKIIEEVKEKYEVFFLFAAQGSYTKEMVVDGTESSPWGASGSHAEAWAKLLGQNAIVLDDAEAVCETIALTLGVMEGTVTLEDGMDDLVAAGADPNATKAAGKALATVGAGASVVAESSGDLTDLDDSDSGTERL